MLSNTQRAQFAIIAAVCLIGMKLPVILLLPIAGLGYAAFTGNCFSTPYVEQLLGKFGIEK
jgi:hypothetical protein